MTADRDAPPPGQADDHDRLVRRLRLQARSAAALGSPLYEHLLDRIAGDVADRGPCWTVLSHVAEEDDRQAVPLRFMAAVHRLVLRRQAPALALHYPSVGGTAGVEGSWDPFRATVEEHAAALVDLVALPCQTNEVGRSAALGPGLAWLVGRHDLPLHHREIGTSAGLNLRWDRFRYGTADEAVTWGPSDSPVDLVGHWRRPPTGLPPTVEVGSRAGCDPAPLDPTSPADRETLTASVWADMTARHERLRGALALALAVPATVDRVRAGDWLAQTLAERPQAGLTVVSHSVVWRYIPAAEQARITALIADAGATASRTAPLAWLRLEPRPPAVTYDGTPYPILATAWPGGETVELGSAQAHGQEVIWTGPHPKGGR